MDGDITMEISIMYEKSSFWFFIVQGNLKTLLNLVFQWSLEHSYEMEKYDEFVLNDTHWMMQSLRKYFFHECSKFKYYINKNLHGLNDAYVQQMGM